jgi:hypothetical protein
VLRCAWALFTPGLCKFAGVLYLSNCCPTPPPTAALGGTPSRSHPGSGQLLGGEGGAKRRAGARVELHRRARLALYRHAVRRQRPGDRLATDRRATRTVRTADIHTPADGRKNMPPGPPTAVHNAVWHGCCASQLAAPRQARHPSRSNDRPTAVLAPASHALDFPEACRGGRTPCASCGSTAQLQGR